MDYKDIQYTDNLEFYSLMPARIAHEAILESAFKDDFFMVSAGKFTYAEPVKTKITMGKRLCDVLTFNDGVNKVISEKVFNCLKKNNITGWRTYPVSIEGVNKHYHGFQVTGRSGKLIEPEKQNGNDFSYTGIKFIPDSWDGSDIFFPNETNLPLITSKVKELLESINITNVEIKHIKDFNGYF